MVQQHREARTTRRHYAYVHTEEHATLLAACRTLPVAQDDRIAEYVTNLMLTVVDDMLVTKVVEKARAQYTRYHWEVIRTHADLVQIFSQYPATQDGNTALATYLWGYTLWTRAQQLRDLTAYCGAIGVSDQAALKNWAFTSTFKGDFAGKVTGLGPAIYTWLVMRQGVATIKPDVRVHRFVRHLVGHTHYTDDEIIAHLITVAEELNLPAYTLDFRIWEHGASRVNRI